MCLGVLQSLPEGNAVDAKQSTLLQASRRGQSLLRQEVAHDLQRLVMGGWRNSRPEEGQYFVAALVWCSTLRGKQVLLPGLACYAALARNARPKNKECKAQKHLVDDFGYCKNVLAPPAEAAAIQQQPETHLPRVGDSAAEDNPTLVLGAYADPPIENEPELRA